MNEEVFKIWFQSTGMTVTPYSRQTTSNEYRPAVIEVEAAKAVEIAQSFKAVKDTCVLDPDDEGIDGDDDDSDEIQIYHRVNVTSRGENTEAVDAAFRAAGNPKFQDVRFKAAAATPAYRKLTTLPIVIKQPANW
jgi:hypothetical protein